MILLPQADRLLDIAQAFRAHAPTATAWTLRLVAEIDERITVRRDVPEPPWFSTDVGAMVTVWNEGGVGYAATADLSPEGLRLAAALAVEWTCATRGRMVHAAAPATGRPTRCHHRVDVSQPWQDKPTASRIEHLTTLCRALRVSAAIVDWSASLHCRRRISLLVGSDGREILQEFESVTPQLRAVANHGGETQIRSFGGDLGGLGGLERLDLVALDKQPERLADEALALLDAPECPSGETDLILMPGQMILQIHESIGHPLELDRILGDERNYAGSSFVTPEMFGTYRYGSPLLNVTFDPDVPGELAGYRYDDEGSPAERAFLIRDGILLRGLGGRLSQDRSGLPGVACTRASSWNRPAIDRMANLNLEPGNRSLTELIAGVERGVLMESNRSWSIDDSRNKFQFGCEIGWLIEDGEMRGMVRNPGYRGVSASFWRSLDGVGNHESLRVMGVGNCGKGEPNQTIAVGHASPPCLFRSVSVFGPGG